MIYTFYSFKGGVGRSMAMASVAWLMARRGLRVLAIDFDLEAPGLERYFFNDERTLDDVRSKPGLMDLLLTYKRALTSESEFQSAAFKNWRTYVTPAIPNTPEGGSVDLMSSGQRHPHEAYATYALNVRAFDWQDFFHNWQGGGFFDWLRRALTDRELDPQNAYDVVLVDSRTGVTEMGGVCAYQLADVAVLLCAPNYQNMDGTRAVLRDFRSDAVIALRQGRPLELVLLPARVEPSDEDKRRVFFETLRSVFGSDGLPRVLMEEGLDYERIAVPYQKELAIIERVVDEGAEADARSAATQSAIRRSFETLTDALLLLAEGERWSEVREKARARLRGGGETMAAVQADVSQRGAGYDAFLVAHPQEWIAAGSIAASLTEQGLDVLQERGALESNRRDQAMSQLQLSRTLLVCIGEAAPSDAYWQCYRAAQSGNLPKPIVALLLAGADSREECLRAFGLPAQTPTLDLRASEGAGELLDTTREELRRLLQPQRAEASSEPASADTEFYPGADAYSEDQSALLFGRDEDAEQLFGLVRDHSVVLLEGSPGVGKNSVINAGLLPRMRERGLKAWRVVQIKLSGPDAAEAIDDALAQPDTDSVLVVLYAIDSFPHGGGADVRRQRVGWVNQFLEQCSERRKLLLVWCGSLPDVERKEAEQAWLGNGVGAGRGAHLRLGPLSVKEQREAIERPAARAGHLFEAGLVDRLIRDAGTQPGAMAQVQLALHDIWAARRRGWLTNRAYDERGGIAGRYNERLDQFVRERSPQTQLAIQTLLKNLVRFDSQLILCAQPQEWSMLASIPLIARADAEDLRDRLASARLIDFWRAPGAADDREVLWCALAQPVPGRHIEQWARADVEFLLWRQRFAVFIARGSLVTAAELDIAQRWASTHGEQLSDAERALIQRSVEAHAALIQTEQKRERERARLLLQRVRLLGIGIAITLVLLAVAGYQWNKAQRQARALQMQALQLRTESDEVRRQIEFNVAQNDAERERRITLANELADLQEKLGRLGRDVESGGGPTAQTRDAYDAVQQQANNLKGFQASAAPIADATPLLYIQFALENQRRDAEALAWQLRRVKLGGKALLVPGVERVKTAVPQDVLRCFDAAECGGDGRLLIEAIGAEIKGSTIKIEDLSARYGKLDALRPHRFELWLAPGPVTLARDAPPLLGFALDVFACAASGPTGSALAESLAPTLKDLGAKTVRQRSLSEDTRLKLNVPRPGVQLRYSQDDANERLAVDRMLKAPPFAAAGARAFPVQQKSPAYLSVFVCPAPEASTR